MNNRNNNQSRGAALMLFVIFFIIGSTVLVLGITRGVYEDLVGYRIRAASVQGFYAAEAGIEDAIYRHRDGRAYSNTETFAMQGATTSVTRTLVVDSFEIVSVGTYGGTTKRSELWLSVGDGAAFSFGLQSGNGGILMSNSTSVIGNVFSNGTVEGAGTAIVRGDVISAGPSGLVDSIHATGSVWAHTIENSVIDTNAYYFSTSTLIGTVVGGTQFPGNEDEATATMPISDSMIEDWKQVIEDTGTVISSASPECLSGTYTINTNTTLNNVKIECNVDLKKQGASTVVTFAGPVWIEGNLSFSSGPTIVASSSLGTRSVQIIVDDEDSHATGSKISVNQSTVFSSGNAQSFVLLISMNTDAEDGGSEKAIDLAQSASGKVLVYASHGRVSLGNNISLKEVTGYQIDISNGAEVVYESGLMSLLFTGGPGGGYAISSWQEI